VATGGDRVASRGHRREEGADGLGPLAREGEIAREGSAADGWGRGVSGGAGARRWVAWAAGGRGMRACAQGRERRLGPEAAQPGVFSFSLFFLFLFLISIFYFYFFYLLFF
jgi:hypothetical protein